MAMVLVQPAIGSTGWGSDVNANFQTVEDFCNALPVFPKSAARVSSSVDQPWANGHQAALVWDTASGGSSYASAGMWSVVNPSRLVAPVAGVYAFSGSVGQSGMAGACALYVIKNGVVKPLAAFGFPYGYGSLNGHCMMAVGDYLELLLYNGTGGPISVYGDVTSPYGTFLAMASF